MERDRTLLDGCLCSHKSLSNCGGYPLVQNAHHAYAVSPSAPREFRHSFLPSLNVWIDGLWYKEPASDNSKEMTRPPFENSNSADDVRMVGWSVVRDAVVAAVSSEASERLSICQMFSRFAADHDGSTIPSAHRIAVLRESSLVHCPPMSATLRLAGMNALVCNAIAAL